MQLRDLQILADYQMHCDGAVDAAFKRLDDALQDLTTLSQARNGRHDLRKNRDKMKDALRTLHDLYVETEKQPMIRRVV